MKALCLNNSDVTCSAAALTGGKGSSLAILNSIDGVTVPSFFCITTHAFRKHFEQNKDASKLLKELQALSDIFQKNQTDNNQKILFEKAGDLREFLENQPMIDEIAQDVQRCYALLPKKEGKTVFCAVRSSATTEDTKDASFAG